MSGLDAMWAAVSSPVRATLEAALEGREVSAEEGAALMTARGADLYALSMTADALRRQQAGDAVTYVVNRNVNFTNVCVKSCHFCAFSRDLRNEQSYFLGADEVVRRAREAADWGASEVCIQAGLAPTADGGLYAELTRAVKAAAPELHIHAWSPEEVKYASQRARRSIRDVLAELKEAGLGSLPGTSAEILDDRIRDRISPGRISTDKWIEVVTTAHALGIPTTSTMMFGHVESPLDRARHMALLRDIQKDTGGFTEFVPLSFVHAEAPLFAKQVAREGAPVSPGPTGDEVIALYAVARLMLGATFRNIQASWVKEGLRMAQWLLSCGVNDLGGTLINESISTSAGAQHGQLVSPGRLRRVIRDAGRVPVERSTLYAPLREFGAEGDDPIDRLDTVEDAEGTFGSYDALTRDERFRYTFDADAVRRRS